MSFHLLDGKIAGVIALQNVVLQREIDISYPMRLSSLSALPVNCEFPKSAALFALPDHVLQRKIDICKFEISKKIVLKIAQKNSQ